MRFHVRNTEPSNANRRSASASSLGSVVRSFSAPKHSIFSVVRLLGPWIAGFSAIVLIGGAVLVWWLLRDSMRQLIGDSLRANLSSNVTTIELWLAQRRRDAERLSSDPEIRDAAAMMIAASQSSFDWTANDAKLTKPLSLIAETLDPTIAVGWSLLDRDGQVIASTIYPLVGLRLAIPEDSIRRIRDGKSTVSRPFACPLVIDEIEQLSYSGAPLMAALSPVMVDSRWVGSIAILIDPNRDFSNMLKVARLGFSGDIYALDRAGVLVSRSRFESQLRTTGLLNRNPKVSSIMRITSRDPGINLATSDQIVTDVSKHPLTLMADQLTRGGTGHDVVGYNDYRGVLVVGAWAWLPEYEIGVASEISVDEVYAPVRLLSRLILVLTILSAVIAAGLATMSWFLRRLNLRAETNRPAKRRIRQYEVGEPLGRGGMGTVYRATHEQLKRTVAIKVLEGDAMNSQSIARFEREAQLTAGLRHPNTIALYDFGRTDDGTIFYVMEHVEGITLQQLVDRYGAQPPARVIHLLLQVCGSLSEAHQLGLIHRDIKPANLMISGDLGIHDRIKVLDFGLVKDLQRRSLDMSLTSSDGITGTPMYMSPEMVRDAAMSDQRSDVYSLGGVGYTLLTGEPMFDSDASVEICMKQLREDPLRPSLRIGKPLPEDLQNVLMSCLRKDPAHRPMSIEDLAAALHQCEDAGRWDQVDALRWWSLLTDDTASNDDPEKSDRVKTKVGDRISL